jgi:hypothetical protein
MRLAACLAIVVALSCAPAFAEVYHCYFGNTHAHTAYSDGKGTPADHYGMAKAAGYDFYAITNHALAKYKAFTAQSYEDTKSDADKFTDATFVAIVGFEFSENDGPGGTGHLNALNTAGYLDATGKDVNLPVFYDWLATKQTTTVAASFNHPSPNTYNSYDYLTPARRDAVSMYEVINSGKPHYEGYIAALEKGWHVAPIAAEDGHGTGRIKDSYRTGVLAPSLTREDIMQAMRARRVYCTWDGNLHLTFSANGYMMGSTLTSPASLDFRVSVSDPDIGDAGDCITKIEIVGDKGAVVATKDFSAYAVTWQTTCDPKCKYYFVKVYTADKTDGPTAYSAPVWVETQP